MRKSVGQDVILRRLGKPAFESGDKIACAAIPERMFSD